MLVSLGWQVSRSTWVRRASRTLVALATACGPTADDNGSSRDDAVATNTASAPSPATAVTGEPSAPGVDSAFVELPSVGVRFGDVEGLVPAGRFFYRFAAATANAPSSRLCIVFNGGPGSGSASLWLQLGPSATRSVTELCHALFIDARGAGLSYQLVDSPETHQSSFIEFNAFVDAADHLRVIAAMLPHLPSRLRQVVLLGESYGGVRASLMADLLLSPDAERPFESAEVWAELRPIFDDWGAELDELELRQVLLQPTLAGRAQDRAVGDLMRREGSPLRRLAKELKHELSSCDEECDGFWWMLDELALMGRSAYDSRASDAWLAQQFETLDAYAARADGLLPELVLAGIPWGLPAADRGAAFRVTLASGLPPDPKLWTQQLGDLNAADRYFVSFNDEVYAHFTSLQARELRIDAFESSFGEVFLDNVRRVRTFVTRAEFDLLNYSPAIPLALSAFSSVTDVWLDEAAGGWHVQYADGDHRLVRAPAYRASHAVALDEPERLLDDVAAWLSE